MNLLRILAALWRVNVAEELQYRANFFASVFDTALWLAAALLTVGIFFSHTSRLGDWNYWQVVALLGVFNALVGWIEGVFRPGIGSLPGTVRSGAFDLVLARPVDAQVFASLRSLNIWRSVDIIAGLSITAYAATRAEGHVPYPTQIAAFAIAFASAATIIYAIWLALMSLAFWFVAVENASVLFEGIYEAARYPVSAYPGALRFVFVYLLPIAWTTTIPAAAITGRIHPMVAFAAVGVAAIALVSTRLLWRAALRRYTSAGG